MSIKTLKDNYLILTKKTVAVILAGAFLFTGTFGWAEDERLFSTAIENTSPSSRSADNTKLAPSSKLNSEDFKYSLTVGAICKHIEHDGNLDNKSYLNDVLVRLDAEKNHNITVLPYEIIIEVPNEGLAVRYFDPTKANVVTPYSDISKLQTEIIGPRLHRQIIHRIFAIPDAKTELSENIKTATAILANTWRGKNNTDITNDFNKILKMTAQDEGIELRDNQKVALFIGEAHIRKGYYYKLFENIVYEQLGIKIAYLPFSVEKDSALAQELLQMVEHQLKNNPLIVGAVITRPWKERFFNSPVLDDNQSECGAVNYIVKDRAGKLSGLVVDPWIEGLIHDMGGYDFSNKNIVMLGCGGAAKEIAFALNGKSVRNITFADIEKDTERSMRELLEKNRRTLDYAYKFVNADDVKKGVRSEELHTAIENADIIINATGVGRSNTKGQSPLLIPVSYKPSQIASDLISGEDTQFLQDARAAGAKNVFNGRAMFIYGMVGFMKGWISKVDPKLASQAGFDTRLFNMISTYLDNLNASNSGTSTINEVATRKLGDRIVADYQLGGKTREVDIQIPAGISLNQKVEQVTFVFDIDKTLTATGTTGITKENMEQIIRAARLQKEKPNLKVRIILISGSAYKRFVSSRLASRVKDWDWEQLHRKLTKKTGLSDTEVGTLLASLRQEMEQSGQFTSDEHRAFPNVIAAIEKRVVDGLVSTLKESGLKEFLSKIDIITATGGEEARYNPAKESFEYYTNPSVQFQDEAEGLAIVKALAISYLRDLGIRLVKDTEKEQNAIAKSEVFLGPQGVNAIFQKAIESLGLQDVEILPFNHEIHIVFNDERGVDGVGVAQEALDALIKQGVLRQGVEYRPKGGSNYSIISLVDKADEIERRVAKDEILVQGGDSTTDSFLFDSRFAGMINIFLGKRKHVEQWPNAIIALDENWQDNVQARGSGLLIQHVLDVMERGGVWGEVKFLNNQVSPYEIFGNKTPSAISEFQNAAYSNLHNHIDKSKALFQNILGKNKPDTLVRVPVEAIESMGIDNIKDFLATFQEAPNGYVELYCMSGTSDVGEGVYQKYGLRKKSLPKDFRPTRENTVTLFPALKGEEINQSAIVSRLGHISMTPEKTILSPIGLQHDPAGLIRATILGLKMMDIARQIKDGRDIDKDLITRDILQALRNVCDEADFNNFNLSPNDIIALAAGDINMVIPALNKLIKLLPTTPINAEELRQIYEHVKAVITSA